MMTKIKKILFPHDLSENASKMIPYVLLVAKAYSSKIYLLHVVDDLPRWGKAYIPHTSMDVFQKEAVKAGEEAVDKLRKEQLRDHPDVETKVVSGDPGSEILSVIESEDVDLVIMGTHGRKGLEQILFGSVAENVVKRAPVPVMTVNPHKLE